MSDKGGCSHTQTDNETAVPNAVIFCPAIEEPAAKALCYHVVRLAGRPSVFPLRMELGDNIYGHYRYFSATRRRYLRRWGFR